METNDKTLYYLTGLSDYKVTDDDCDVRGWTVSDATGRTVGRVDGLLVSKDAGRVVYLDVEVSSDVRTCGRDGQATADGMYVFSNEDGGDHLIIPVGLVTLEEEAQKVLTPQIHFSTFAATDRFLKGRPIERDYEIYVRRHFLGKRSDDEPTSTDASFYTGQEFEHRLTRRKR